MAELFYEFEGIVIHGEKRGGLLGFPTINLKINSFPLKYGIYICQVIIEEKKFWGVGNFGPIPTFNEMIPRADIYLLNFKNTIYEEKVTVWIMKFLRDIKKFESKEDLIKQIKKDVSETKKWIKSLS